jgi:hypothetical protein
MMVCIRRGQDHCDLVMRDKKFCNGGPGPSVVTGPLFALLLLANLY